MTSKTPPKGETLSLPMLPLRDVVVYPHMVVPLVVGRKRSKYALREAMQGDESQILLLSQKQHDVNDPSADDLYTIGTVANVVQLLRSSDESFKVLVEGVERAQVRLIKARQNFDLAEVIVREDKPGDPVKLEALTRSVVEEFENYAKVNRKTPPEVANALSDFKNPSKVADVIASHMPCPLEEKQKLLETFSLSERMERLLRLIESEVKVINVEKKIRGRVKRQMERSQREYYLNEQIKAIQKELGEEEPNEFDQIRRRIDATALSEEAREKADSELKKLKSMSPASAEASVVRNYLDWILAIPWGRKSRVRKDLNYAQKVLEQEHYGLEEVKERIIEFLAVQKRARKIKGPIICLVGPPGVGKTSLGKSIAKATGREFVRFSLGGVRDEAEIRGHRRTYVGSMPGKIIQSLRKTKSVNPLFLLDEVDKMGMDFRGDPSSALLEVLDPEQNAAYKDHYLEVDYDLSDIMFITTANTMNIQPPLLDRMEIIRIAGYTEEEKLEIVKRHLWPKAVANHGLKAKEIEIQDDMFMRVIRVYTREAGVRSLERVLSKIARKVVTRILRDKAEVPFIVNEEAVEDLLGPAPFRYGRAENNDQIGIVTGLAWTQVGGELLTVEGVMMPGKGKMTVTGNLSTVMKESISAAAAYVRSRASDFAVESRVFSEHDVHVHVPEGATPKDGPSAGIAMATAILSLVTSTPVRRNVAMTGEVTLRGRVLPIGGLKEKLLAALRGGIEKVLIPEENVKDLKELPDALKSQLEIIPVSGMDEVISHTLVRRPTPKRWSEQDEDDDMPMASKKVAKGETSSIRPT